MTDLCKIAVMGDWRQLESIEPGNVLGDLQRSFIAQRELQKNHRTKVQKILITHAL